MLVRSVPIHLGQEQLDMGLIEGITYLIILNQNENWFHKIPSNVEVVAAVVLPMCDTKVAPFVYATQCSVLCACRKEAIYLYTVRSVNE